MKTQYPVNCVIVDDEPIAIEGIKRLLNSVDSMRVSAAFHNPVEASEYLESNPVDLLFLDIKMPSMNGIGLLESLSKKPLVIFTTAYSSHAVEAFQLDAVDYLLKPISLEKLVKAINKARRVLQKPESNGLASIFVRSDGKYHRLEYSDIIYIEGMKDYVKIHKANEVLSVAMNLTRINERLSNSDFIRVHKSYLVNIKKITKLDSSEILLGHITVPLGATYRDEVQEKLLADRVLKR